MKIINVGQVIIGNGPIRIEGFLVSPEDGDPKNVSLESQTVQVCAEWALGKLQATIEASARQRLEELAKNTTFKVN